MYNYIVIEQIAETKEKKEQEEYKRVVNLNLKKKIILWAIDFKSFKKMTTVVGQTMGLEFRQEFIHSRDESFVKNLLEFKQIFVNTLKLSFNQKNNNNGY